MPTNTWEPPPRQSDSDSRARTNRSDEPRNSEPARRDYGRNHDASAESERSYSELNEINVHGSER
jgi:hypothetical protein